MRDGDASLDVSPNTSLKAINLNTINNTINLTCNLKTFITNAIFEMLNDGVKVNLYPRKYVISDGLKVRGYYNDEPLEFKVATLKPSWPKTFIHEYCHYTQWRDKAQVWTNTDDNDVNRWVDWLNGSRCLTKARAKAAMVKMRAVELDCEQRVVKVIRKYQLPIDIKSYIKEANAYCAFYTVSNSERRWSSKTTYEDPKVLSLVPSTWIKDFDNLDSDLYKAIKDCLVTRLQHRSKRS